MSLQFRDIDINRVHDPELRMVLKMLDDNLRALYQVVNQAIQVDTDTARTKFKGSIVPQEINRDPTTARAYGEVGETVQHKGDHYIKQGAAGNDTNWRKL